jgi:rRNA maturation RNase YbeY
MIAFYAPSIPFVLPHKTVVKQWLKAVAAAEKKRVGEVSFVFCDDAEVLRINRQYLQHDYYTDVITFDYSVGDVIAGDVFISVDTVQANARRFKQSFEDELNRVMVHGILHLCGYRDGTAAERKQMRAKEDAYVPVPVNGAR